MSKQNHKAYLKEKWKRENLKLVEAVVQIKTNTETITNNIRLKLDEDETFEHFKKRLLVVADYVWHRAGGNEI